MDLIDRAVEVHREPAARIGERRRPGYTSVVILRPPAVVAPLEASSSLVPIAELLP